MGGIRVLVSGAFTSFSFIKTICRMKRRNVSRFLSSNVSISEFSNSCNLSLLAEQHVRVWMWTQNPVFSGRETHSKTSSSREKIIIIIWIFSIASRYYAAANNVWKWMDGLFGLYFKMLLISLTVHPHYELASKLQ